MGGTGNCLFDSLNQAIGSEGVHAASADDLRGVIVNTIPDLIDAWGALPNSVQEMVLAEAGYSRDGLAGHLRQMAVPGTYASLIEVFAAASYLEKMIILRFNNGTQTPLAFNPNKTVTEWTDEAPLPEGAICLLYDQEQQHFSFQSQPITEGDGSSSSSISLLPPQPAPPSSPSSSPSSSSSSSSSSFSSPSTTTSSSSSSISSLPPPAPSSSSSSSPSSASPLPFQ
jgi:hypothetical protein